MHSSINEQPIPSSDSINCNTNYLPHNEPIATADAKPNGRTNGHTAIERALQSTNVLRGMH
jgi:hypothetical protein